MAESHSQSASTTFAVSYALVFLIFGSLFYIAPSVARPISISGSSSLWDWLVVVSILASSWSLWLMMVRQRCLRGLGVWRLLRANLGAVSVFFLITAAAFVLSAVKLDLVIPPESNLMDNSNVSLIAVYSRIPILSHPVLLYVLITALSYKIVQSPLHFRKGILAGGLMVFLYYFIMYACGALYGELMYDILVSPEETHVMIMFVYWLPTVLFALVAYVAYSVAFNSD
jgi:hypothetical protein